MEMSLRIEIFAPDLDAVADFYVRVLKFGVTRDERAADPGYISLERGSVVIGALRRPQVDVGEARKPPTGVEVVLEVDEVLPERDRVVASGWPLEEDLTDRAWGLTDFRVLDPAGYYLRVTSRAAAVTR